MLPIPERPTSLPEVLQDYHTRLYEQAVQHSLTLGTLALPRTVELNMGDSPAVPVQTQGSTTHEIVSNGKQGGNTLHPNVTAEAAKETEELVNELGDLLLLRVAAINRKQDPNAFMRKIIPEGVALPTLPETTKSGEPLPELIGFLVLGDNAEENRNNFHELRNERLENPKVTDASFPGESIATVVGELVADHRKHVLRQYEEDESARKFLDESMGDKLFDGNTEAMAVKKDYDMPEDRNARIIAVWRTPTGAIVTRHTYSWFTENSLNDLRLAYIDQPEESESSVATLDDEGTDNASTGEKTSTEDSFGDADLNKSDTDSEDSYEATLALLMGRRGSMLVKDASDYITIREVPTELTEQIVTAQIPAPKWHRTPMGHMPVMAIHVPSKPIANSSHVSVNK